MIYFIIIVIIILYAVLFRKHKEILQYVPLSRKRVLNLFSRLSTHSNKYTLYLLYAKLISTMILILIGALTLKLKMNYIVLLMIFTALCIPFVLIWNLNYEINRLEFSNLEVYLTQFILIFRSHEKIIFVLNELTEILEGAVKENVKAALKAYEGGADLPNSLSIISDAYPHFIVYNLHALVLNVEQHGSLDYQEGLDLIQDDIDDWSEDVETYDKRKKDIITKVNILIAFAFLICYIALKMLFAVSLNTETPLYQSTMFIFCLIEILTFVLTQSINTPSFIQKSERLC